MEHRPSPEVLRRIPRTDDLLREPGLVQAAGRLGAALVKDAVRQAQQQARQGAITPDEVLGAAVGLLPRAASSLRPVLNATGIVVHTNIGRAPLSPAATEAVTMAAGTVDVELDLASGQRSRRGEAVEQALLAAVPRAQSALVVNNGAAALLLAVTALAATPSGTRRELVVSRGELVEIGARFRLPDLMQSTGARLREVGTTNRTHLADYADVLGPDVAAVVKVHPSNFRVEGFTSGVDLPELASITGPAGIPLLADIGSGLLLRDPLLPDEPDATSALAAGADLVTCSGDKLLGGPQAGIILGHSDLVDRLRHHPMARALRVDKLTLAALEATLRGGETPVAQALHATDAQLRSRAEALVAALAEAGIEAELVPSEGRVGGGGAPGVPLPGWAVALATTGAQPSPDHWALALRTGDPAVLPRVESGRCLLDLRCIPDEQLPTLVAAVIAASRPAQDPR